MRTSHFHSWMAGRFAPAALPGILPAVAQGYAPSGAIAGACCSAAAPVLLGGSLTIGRRCVRTLRQRESSRSGR
jgi:hypothetical protein